jgi:hypothetical protein
MNKSAQKNSFRYSRTPYSAENVKNTRLHPGLGTARGVFSHFHLESVARENAIILRWVLHDFL